MSDNYKARKKSAAKGNETIICDTCGDAVERKGLLYPKTDAIIHCEGSKAAYGCSLSIAHHCTIQWPDCWRCGAGMGCAVCVSQAKFDPETKSYFSDDLTCKPCRVKVTLESLLNGGPISKHFMRQGNDKLEWGTIAKHTPDLGEYPKEWVAAYARQCYALGMDPDADDTAAWKACRKVFEQFHIGAISKPKGRLALQRERNRQVAALREPGE